MEIKVERQQSEICPLSTWSNDSTWNHTFFVGTQRFRVNATPRLLGVIQDRVLTFKTYLKKLTTLLTSSIHISRATAHIS